MPFILYSITTHKEQKLMDDKKMLVTENDVTKGVLHGNAGTFRIYIDGPTCGAKNFSLLQNTIKAGATGSSHKHDEEHCFYVLSGTGTMNIDGKSYEMRPGSAIFVPPNAMHQPVVDEGEDLNVIVIYSPPGPEQKLRNKQANAFDDTASGNTR
jgi:quercetin dioxygenase-like cupin family protein